MKTTLLDSALALADLGYPIFPCAVNGKAPLTARGLTDATTDAEQLEKWWADFPQANIGLVTAGLLVVDMDTIDGQDNPWLSDQPDKLLDLTAGILSRTPRGGRHYIFRATPGKPFRNTASKLAPKVDTRADGGYIVVAPSAVNGKPYEWAKGQQLDCERDKLPLPPAWLVDMLDGTAPSSARTGHCQKTSELGTIPDGQRNSTLTSIAGALRYRGLSQSALAAALHVINRERCQPPLPDKEIETIARSTARYAYDAKATEALEGFADAIHQSSSVRDPGDFPEGLLYVPGFVGDVVSYNLATARKPQPILALAGALSLLAVLTGRKVCDKHDTRTNLYVIGVGESGCGKEHARTVNKSILAGAGMKGYFCEDMASHVGLINRVESQPCSLFQVDEFGRVLVANQNEKSAPHLFHIGTVMMRLFTSAHTIFTTPTYADKDKTKEINQPHCCLYATTTPKWLHRGLTAESVEDGFLSRMLVFETKDDPKGVDFNPEKPPRFILDVASYWRDLKPTAGDLEGVNPTPLVVPRTAEATQIIEALEDLSREEKVKLTPELGTIWTRVTEKAAKLAILYACSVDCRHPLIDATAARWAVSLAEYLTRKLILMAAEHLSENLTEAKFKRVLRIVKSATAEGLTLSQLCRKTQWLSGREREDILEELKLQGAVSEESFETFGRPRTVIKAV